MPPASSTPAGSTVDFLSHQGASAAVQPLVSQQQQSTNIPPQNSTSNNIVDLFDTMNVSAPSAMGQGHPTANQPSNNANPFDPFSPAATTAPLPKGSNPIEASQKHQQPQEPMQQQYSNPGPTYAVIPATANVASANRSPIAPSNSGMQPFQHQQGQQPPAFPTLMTQQQHAPTIESQGQPPQPWPQQQQQQPAFPLQQQFPVQGPPPPQQPYHPTGVAGPGGYMMQPQQPPAFPPQGGYPPPSGQNYPTMQQQQHGHPPPQQTNRSVASQFDPFAKR
jgi:hypothetical protein